MGLRPDRSPYDQSVTDSLTRCFPPAYCAQPHGGLTCPERRGRHYTNQDCSTCHMTWYKLWNDLCRRAANVFHQRSSASGRSRPASGLDAGGWGRSSQNEVEEENEREAMTIIWRLGAAQYVRPSSIFVVVLSSVPLCPLPLLFVFLCSCPKSLFVNVFSNQSFDQFTCSIEQKINTTYLTSWWLNYADSWRKNNNLFSQHTDSCLLHGSDKSKCDGSGHYFRYWALLFQCYRWTCRWNRELIAVDSTATGSITAGVCRGCSYGIVPGRSRVNLSWWCPIPRWPDTYDGRRGRPCRAEPGAWPTSMELELADAWSRPSEPCSKYVTQRACNCLSSSATRAVDFRRIRR